MSRADARRFHLSIRNNHELFSIRKSWGALHYFHQMFLDEEEIHRREKIIPSKAQWQAFADTVDEIGIWNWKRDYPNPGIIGGGNKWEVDVAIGGRHVSARGDCSYPGSGTPSGNVYEVSREFSDFLRAVRELIGELPLL